MLKRFQKKFLDVSYQDDQDVYILSKVSDIMHSLLGTYKEATLPVFEQLLPHFMKLLVSIAVLFPFYFNKLFIATSMWLCVLCLANWNFIS